MRWIRLPASLEQALQDKLEVGRIVPAPMVASLGPEGSYFVALQNGVVYGNLPDAMRNQIESMQSSGHPLQLIAVSRPARKWYPN